MRAGESWDAVTRGLCLSELGEDEVQYALEQSVRLLKPASRARRVDPRRRDDEDRYST